MGCWFFIFSLENNKILESNKSIFNSFMFEKIFQKLKIAWRSNKPNDNTDYNQNNYRIQIIFDFTF